MTMPRVADSINISPCPQHARNLHRSGPIPARYRSDAGAAKPRTFEHCRGQCPAPHQLFHARRTGRVEAP